MQWAQASAVLWLALSVPAAGQALVAPMYGSPYAQTREWSQQRWSLPRTAAEVREDHARILRTNYGDRGVLSLFKQPLGPVHIPIGTPGLEETVRLAASDNPNVARGHRRELLLANHLGRNPRIEIEGLGQVTINAEGKTDADIAFRDTVSGQRVRMEVKDYQGGVVNADERIRGQIDKMAEDRRQTGRLQALVIRQRASAPLREYAASRGIPVYEDVVTGEKSRLRAGALLVDDVVNDFFAAKGSPAASSLASNRQPTRTGPLLRQRLTTPRILDNRGLLGLRSIRSIGRWTGGNAGGWGGLRGAGRGLAMLGAAYTVYEGAITLYQWNSGAMTNREALRRGTAAGAGAVGAYAGFKVGAVIGGSIGTLVPVVGTAFGAGIGGFGGATIGYFTGSAIAGRSTSAYFRLQDADDQEELRRFMFELYDVQYSRM